MTAFEGISFLLLCNIYSKFVIILVSLLKIWAIFSIPAFPTTVQWKDMNIGNLFPSATVFLTEAGKKMMTVVTSINVASAAT